MRLLSLMLVALLLTVVFAAGSASAAEEITAEEYASMTWEDLVAKGSFADPENLTPEDVRWLVDTFRFVDIDYEKLALTASKNITREALGELRKALPKKQEFISLVLQSEYPQARRYAYEQLNGYFKSDASDLETALDVLIHEEDPFCLYSAVNSVGNEIQARPEIAEFIFRMADHENPMIRTQAVCDLASSSAIGLDGACEKVIAMMHDEDQNVRSAACFNAGRLRDEAVIPPLTEILNNSEEEKLHQAALRGLSTMWLDYPFHKETCEAAYRVTMDYYARKPRTDRVPSWSGIAAFNTVDAKKIAEWYPLATYFNADEFFRIMADCITDPEMNWLGKEPAMKAILALCPEKWPELEAVISGVEDQKVTDAYEKLNSTLTAE